MESKWAFPTDKELGVLNVFKQDFLVSLEAVNNQIDSLDYCSISSAEQNETSAFLPLLLQRTFNHSKYALASLLKNPENTTATPLELRAIIADIFPVLADKVQGFNLNWQKNTRKILQRWQTDKKEISRIFFDNSVIGHIKSFAQHKGDEHQDGEQSLILELSCGRKLCYKPRCLEIEQAFFTFAAQLGFDELYQVKYLTYDDYGWMEYIPYESCETQEQIEQYYFRSGLLLSLLYLLEAEDIHHENVIAFGAHPVIVDLETLFHHRDDSVKQAPGKSNSLELGVHTVLKTHFIPQNYSVEQEIAAISPSYGKDTSERNSTALYQGKQIPVNEYIEDFINGFKQGYQRILNKKTQLTNVKTPLNLFSSCTARYVCRSTHIYECLIKAAQHISHQSSSDKLTSLFAKLSIDVKERGFLEQLITTEKRSLEAAEIPRFTHKISEKNIYFSNALVSKNYFSYTGIELCQQKIMHLSENDLQGQIELIRCSFNLAKPKQSLPSFNMDNQDKGKDKDKDKALLSSYAKDIASFVNQQHIDHLNGKIWPVYKSDGTGRTCLDPTNSSFYNGVIGIQFFLAHLQHIFPAVIDRKILIDNTLMTLEQALEKKEHCLGLSGLGGSLYTVSHLMYLWPEQTRLASYANRLIDILAECDITEHDIVSGSAGAILALLSVHRQTQQESALEVAIHLGNKLVGHIKPQENWHSDNNQPYAEELSGFAHGIAGMGYALIKLSVISGISVFKSSALQVLEAESQGFSDEINNWPDKRFSTKLQQDKEAMTAWCHGAVGIALSRLKLKKLLKKQTPLFINQDIDRGLALLKNSNLEEDCLCHGNFGNYELYLSAIEQHHDNSFNTNELVALIKHRIKIIADKGCNHPNSSIEQNLGFMTGWSGLGYQLLRFTYPEKVPNALLLDFVGE